MKLLFTLAAFVLALGVLIFIHEMGHYLIARIFGVKVLRFSIGFGKPVFVKTLGLDQTEWAVGTFPLGGYVKMLDEREGPVSQNELHRAFNQQSVYRRSAIVIAGPIANLLLAILLYWGIFMLGVPGLKPVIGDVPVKTPASMAEFQKGELILKVNQEPVKTWQEVRWALLQSSFQNSSVIMEVENERGELAFRHLSTLGVSADDDQNEDILSVLGLVHFQPELFSKIGQLTADGAATRDGLQVDDEIISVNKQPITHWEAFFKLVRANPGIPMHLEVSRHSTRINLIVTPDAIKDKGKVVGKIGAGPWIDPAQQKKLMIEVSYPPLRALQEGIIKTWDTSIFSLKMLWRMVTGRVSLKNISGPITIADYAGQTAHMGWLPYLSFIALISISLGVLNLLPIPLLDGGHLLYYMIEIIKRSPVSERVMWVGQQVGIVILLTLMAFAFYNDVNRLLTG